MPISALHELCQLSVSRAPPLCYHVNLHLLVFGALLVSSCTCFNRFPIVSSPFSSGRGTRPLTSGTLFDHGIDQGFEKRIDMISYQCS